MRFVLEEVEYYMYKTYFCWFFLVECFEKRDDGGAGGRFPAVEHNLERTSKKKTS
jgi:hypothetical protein